MQWEASGIYIWLWARDWIPADIKSNNINMKIIGNCFFWINFVFVGQPLAAMIYFYSWQAKFGSLAPERHAAVIVS